MYQQIRTIQLNNETYFVGKDIADTLGYQNGSRDINRHVDEEDRTKLMIFDGNQNKETIVINESGMYSLILGSKLESAKRFNDNKMHFVQGEDFFKTKCTKVRPFFGQTQPNGLNPDADIVLLTESGYLMLVKSFTDELA